MALLYFVHFIYLKLYSVKNHSLEDKYNTLRATENSYNFNSIHLDTCASQEHFIVQF